MCSSDLKVTRRAIARQARVAPSLVGYYFGSTAQLLLEAVASMWRDLRDRSRAAVARVETPSGKLLARTRVLLQTHIDNRYFSQLVIEYLLRGKSARARQATEELVQDSFSELSAILRTGAREGAFRHVDPIFLYEAMLGACETFAASQRHLQMLLGGKPFNGDLVDAYARFLCDVVLNGIASAEVKPRRRGSGKAIAAAMVERRR